MVWCSIRTGPPTRQRIDTSNQHWCEMPRHINGPLSQDIWPFSWNKDMRESMCFVAEYVFYIGLDWRCYTRAWWLNHNGTFRSNKTDLLWKIMDWQCRACKAKNSLCQNVITHENVLLTRPTEATKAYAGFNKPGVESAEETKSQSWNLYEMTFAMQGIHRPTISTPHTTIRAMSKGRVNKPYSRQWHKDWGLLIHFSQ